MQRIESQIGGSQLTDAWNIVKSLKMNNTSRKVLMNMETLEKYNRKLLRESRPEFIKKEESIDDTDGLLRNGYLKNIDITIESMKNGKWSGPGGISVELIKYGGDRFRERIQFLLICGLQLPREPHQSTRLLQLTGRWMYNGIM